MSYSPLLPVHISAGIAGILSGTAAMALRKGSPPHALAGKVFVFSMLTMAASAVYLAILKHEINNVFGGILTFYLISTAWLTARRRDGETLILDWFALPIPLFTGIGGWINGFDALHGLTGSKYGVPAGMHFFMGSVMLLAAAGDLRMLVRRGLSGPQRLVRHLWRMCFGLFIATGAFFLGQPQVFPMAIRRTNLLFVPAVLPLVLLIFWVIRVRLGNAYKNNLIGHVAA